ncbi:uncharacterized protein B0J16DRAFT_239181, partial [Fusarium flagelliforme]
GYSTRKAAEVYGVSRSTLIGRINGAKTPKEVLQARQKLSEIQEKRLHHWILIQADLGCPVSHHQVKDFA